MNRYEIFRVLSKPGRHPIEIETTGVVLEAENHNAACCAYNADQASPVVGVRAKQLPPSRCPLRPRRRALNL